MPDDILSAANSNQGVSPRIRALNSNERKAALAAQRSENQNASQEIAAQRLGLEKAKYDQSERHFQTREARQSTESQQQMSLAESQALLSQAAAIVKLAETRFSVESKRRSEMSALQGLDYFANLEVRFDPARHKTESDALREFERSYADGLVKYSSGLENPALLKTLEKKQQDYDRFRTALDSRDALTYSGAAARKYQEVLAKEGDASLANAYAKAVAAQYEQVTKAVESGFVTPGEAEGFRNKDTGEFDIDALNLRVAEKRGKTAVQATDLEGIKTTLSEIRSTFSALNASDPTDPAAKDATDRKALIGKTTAAMDALLDRLQSHASGSGASGTAAPPKRALGLDDLLPKK